MSNTPSEMDASHETNEITVAIGATDSPANNTTLEILVMLHESRMDLSHMCIAEITAAGTFIYHGLEITLDENDVAVMEKLLPHWSEHTLIFDKWQDVDIEYVRQFADKCVAGRDNVVPPYIINECGLVFGDYLVVVDHRAALDPRLESLLESIEKARRQEEVAAHAGKTATAASDEASDSL